MWSRSGEDGVCSRQASRVRRMTNKEALSARMSRVAMSVTGLGPRRVKEPGRRRRSARWRMDALVLQQSREHWHSNRSMRGDYLNDAGTHSGHIRHGERVYWGGMGGIGGVVVAEETGKTVSGLLGGGSSACNHRPSQASRPPQPSAVTNIAARTSSPLFHTLARPRLLC
jgi:hypothetical protein